MENNIYKEALKIILGYSKPKSKPSYYAQVMGINLLLDDEQNAILEKVLKTLRKEFGETYFYDFVCPRRW